MQNCTTHLAKPKSYLRRHLPHPLPFLPLAATQLSPTSSPKVQKKKKKIQLEKNEARHASRGGELGPENPPHGGKVGVDPCMA